MDNSLQQLCDLQLENEGYVRNSKIVGGEEFVKLGALLYTSDNLKPDIEKIRSCKDILKERTKKLSDFQGSLLPLLVMKMSLAEDPGSYIDGIISIYNKFIEGKVFSSLSYVVTAMTIYDRCIAGQMDINTVTSKTISDYEKWTKGKIFSDEWDLPYMALMVTCNKDLDNTIKEINESYKLLKKEHHFPGEIAQPSSFLLTLSPKAPEDKVRDFCDLYEALKKQKCHISSSKEMSIYALLVDINEDKETLANSIAEVSEYFKGKKGYGMLSGTDNLRKSLAASLVLQNRMRSSSDESMAIMSTIVVEEVIYSMIITYFMICNSIVLMS